MSLETENLSCKWSLNSFEGTFCSSTNEMTFLMTKINWFVKLVSLKVQAALLFLISTLPLCLGMRDLVFVFHLQQLCTIQSIFYHVDLTVCHTGDCHTARCIKNITLLYCRGTKNEAIFYFCYLEKQRIPLINSFFHLKYWAITLHLRLTAQ